jgi:hypothetical protein
MRRGHTEGESPKQVNMAEDLDDIATLMNLLELHSHIRNETGRFDNELE